jgi:hypothetical protein
VVNLIPDLPSTTHTEALAALEDIRELADCIHSVQVFPFETTRSSNVGRDLERFGLVLCSDDGGSPGAAQFELNRLNVTDPAMTAAQRHDVHVAYLEFARSLGPARDLDSLQQVQAAQARVRIRAEDLDIFADSGRTVCTQVIARAAVSLSPKAASALAPFLSGQPFTWAQLCGRVGDTRAAPIMQALQAAHMLSMIALDRTEVGILAD